MIKKKMVTLNPDESKAVSFEIIPQEPRTYQVLVDGLAGSFVVREKPQAEFYMPSLMAVKVTDGSILGMYHRCEFSCLITNKGDATGTYILAGRDNLASQWDGPRIWGPEQITLAPGETYRWSIWYHIDFRRVSAPYTWELWGDWENNNSSIGEARP